MVSDFGSTDTITSFMYNPRTEEMFNLANSSFIEQITSLYCGFKPSIIGPTYCSFCILRIELRILGDELYIIEVYHNLL